MKIVKEFLPNDCFYDSALKMPLEQSVSINGDLLTVNFKNLMDTQLAGGNIPSRYEYLRKSLNLGEFSSAPDGGFINFFLVTSKRNLNYIIFSGVNEVNNSHYIITIHKILKE